MLGLVYYMDAAKKRQGLQFSGVMDTWWMDQWMDGQTDQWMGRPIYRDALPMDASKKICCNIEIRSLLINAEETKQGKND